MQQNRPGTCRNMFDFNSRSLRNANTLEIGGNIQVVSFNDFVMQNGNGNAILVEKSIAEKKQSMAIMALGCSREEGFVGQDRLLRQSHSDDGSIKRLSGLLGKPKNKMLIFSLTFY